VTHETNTIIRRALDLVKPQFRLDLNHGQHGIKHWIRVWANAEYLSTIFHVDPTVPCWFAFLHDSQRFNEDKDEQHGYRASEFAHDNQKYIGLTRQQLGSLRVAMVRHSDGITVAGLETRICWDADRLDLGRVGIRPDPARLCTSIARQPHVISAAWTRSRADFDKEFAK